MQKEETPQPAVSSSDEEEVVITDLDRINRPEDRYGCFIVRQLKTEHQLLLKDMCFNSQNVDETGLVVLLTYTLADPLHRSGFLSFEIHS